jgi:shikimate 5-dehydrogenase
MPHKLDVLSQMDQLGPEVDEVDEIGSMNTIVVLRQEGGGTKLEGRNTDVLGIRNALLSTIPLPERESAPPPWCRLGAETPSSAVVIGGGGTTRAAIYALSKMALSPIYLINRDPVETQAMIASFPQYNLVALEDEKEWNEEKAEACQIVVGAIPSLEPVTEGEKMVYRVSEKVFELGEKVGGGPRRFLDMAYKPHVTRMIEIARKYNWLTIGGESPRYKRVGSLGFLELTPLHPAGIEALVHQALAQQKYWLLDPRTATYERELATRGLDEKVFEIAAEQVRRKAGVPLPPS